MIKKKLKIKGNLLLTIVLSESFQGYSNSVWCEKILYSDSKTPLSLDMLYIT